jgi:hypothetical protein
MSYVYSAFVSINDADGRSKNFTLAPTVTVWDGDGESQILSPSPTLVYFEPGLYKVKVVLDVKTDVLFKIDPHVDDQAEIADIKLIHEKVVHVAEDILEDTGTTLPAAIAAVDDDVWSYASRTLTQSATEVVAAVTGSSITQVRGNTWQFDIHGLTLSGDKIQLVVKRTALDTDAEGLLFIDTETGLVTVNGTAADNPNKASLSYIDTTLTVTVSADIAAVLPVGNWHYGIQSVTAGGEVAENYIGTFVIISDMVRATS